MKTVLIVIIMVLPIVYFIIKSGNSKFWRLVKKHPYEAYEFFKNNDCWYVIHPNDNSQKPVEGKWAGPFFTFIPNIGRLKIYGEKGEYEELQEQFIKQFEDKT
mgnify:CR=1 FL=1